MSNSPINNITLSILPGQGFSLAGARVYFEFAREDLAPVFTTPYGTNTAVWIATNQVALQGIVPIQSTTAFNPSAFLPESEKGRQYKVVCVLADCQNSIIDTAVFQAQIEPPPPRLGINRESAGTIRLSLSGRAGTTYRIQRASIIPPQWADLFTTNLVGVTAEWSIPTPNTQNFYRAVWP